jgi:hypothetical protein
MGRGIQRSALRRFGRDCREPVVHHTKKRQSPPAQIRGGGAVFLRPARLPVVLIFKVILETLHACLILKGADIIHEFKAGHRSSVGRAVAS